jgi:competence protein ComEA
MKQVLVGLIGVMAGFALAGLLFFVSRSPVGKPIALQPAPTSAPIAVHVVGAVPRPGLYDFEEGARVQDAIDAAGGLLAEAEGDAVNLAAPLQDGEQLYIPYVAGHEPSSSLGAVLPDEPGASQAELDASDLTNINTATLAELDALPGVGPTAAQSILDYREDFGPFESIEELLDVSGIGPSTFEAIQELITV